MNYDQTEELLNLERANSERFKQMADDLSFIRDRLSIPDTVSAPKAVENDNHRKIKTDDEETSVFNEDKDIISATGQYDTASSFTNNNGQNTKKESSQITVASVMKMINTLLFIANERPNTFIALLENELGYNIGGKTSISKLEYVYDVIHNHKIEEIDKALKNQKLNKEDLYTVYEKFK